MPTSTQENLEQRLARVESELAATRVGGTALRRGRVRSRRVSPRALTLAAVLAAALSAAVAGAGRSSARGAGGDLTVCVGADRVLWLAEGGGRCRAGERQLLLAAGAAGKAAAADRDGAPPAGSNHAPEQAPSRTGEPGTRFKAPFEVVDEAGKTIMRVGAKDEKFSRGVYVYNEDGFGVAHVGVLPDDGGGRVVVRDHTASRTRTVTMAYTDGPYFGMYDADKKLAIINRGGFVWYSGQENPAVKIWAGDDNQAGRLVLADASGTSLLEAGATKNNLGFIRVYPNKSNGPPNYLLSSR